MPEATEKRLALGELVVPGGFFVRAPGGNGAAAPFPVGEVGKGAAYRHCFTYRGESTLRSELLEMLAGAQRKVFVASMLVGDPDVRDALVAAAARLGGGVYVVAPLHDKGLDRVISRVDGDRADVEGPPLSELTREGVSVRGYPGCHAKFVVVDDEVALVSSANLVSRAFDTTGENGVVVNGAERVVPLGRLFARLWQLSPWDVPPDRDAYAVLSRERSADPVGVEPSSDGLGPVWTWGPDRHLLHAVRELADSATEELVLATDSLRDMAAKPELLLDRVRAATERGVRVRVLMRARNDDLTQRTEAVEFAKAGAEIHADPLHRAKGVIADGARGLVGSANLAGRPGLTSGVEVGVRLDGTSALLDAQRYLDHVMAESPSRFARDATVERLAAELDSAALSPWPLPAELDVVATDRDWQRLVRAVGRGGPALFTANGDGAPTLHVGEGRWRLVEQDGKHRVELAEHGSSVQSAAEVLDGWLAETDHLADADSGASKAPSKSTTGGSRRGLCTAVLVRQDTTTKDAEADPEDDPDGPSEG